MGLLLTVKRAAFYTIFCAKDPFEKLKTKSSAKQSLLIARESLEIQHEATNMVVVKKLLANRNLNPGSMYHKDLSRITPFVLRALLGSGMK